jgi:hypothetical protein
MGLVGQRMETKMSDWSKGITYTVIDNFALLRNLGITEEDIEAHGNEMMHQVCYEFNRVPWGVDNLVFSWDVKHTRITK